MRMRRGLKIAVFDTRIQFQFVIQIFVFFLLLWKFSPTHFFYLDWFDTKSSAALVDDDGFEMVADEEDEGWTDVTKKGIKFTEVNQKKGKNLAERKRKNMVLPNFYAHQQREVKKKKIDLIREAYEDSKKQISEARKTRIYKPFS